MMATPAIATLPPLIIYAFAQKQIIETFVTSGIKEQRSSLGWEDPGDRACPERRPGSMARG